MTNLSCRRCFVPLVILNSIDDTFELTVIPNDIVNFISRSLTRDVIHISSLPFDVNITLRNTNEGIPDAPMMTCWRTTSTISSLHRRIVSRMIRSWRSGFSSLECSSHPWRPGLEFLLLWFPMHLFDLISLSRLSSPRRSSSLPLPLPVTLGRVWCVFSWICLWVAPSVMDVFSGEVFRQTWSIRSGHVALSSHLPSAAAEEDLVWITLEPQHHRPLTSLVLSSRRSAATLRLQRSELDLVVKHMLRLLVLASVK